MPSIGGVTLYQCKIVGPSWVTRKLTKAPPGAIGEREYWIGQGPIVFEVSFRIRAATHAQLNRAALRLQALERAQLMYFYDDAELPYYPCTPGDIRMTGPPLDNYNDAEIGGRWSRAGSMRVKWLAPTFPV